MIKILYPFISKFCKNYQLSRKFVDQMLLGPYDIKHLPEKMPFECSKDLNNVKIPNEVLKDCQFKKGENIVETAENLCASMHSVLTWTFEDCDAKVRGERRARRSIKKLGNLCGKMLKVLRKKNPQPKPEATFFHHTPDPEPKPEPTCPYDGNNKICVGSDKCGLAHFASCVQLEVRLRIHPSQNRCLCKSLKPKFLNIRPLKTSL